MWVSRSDYRFLQKRILDLEKQLEKERAENRRRENWMVNMLLRRANTFPVPPDEPKAAVEKKSPEPPKFTSVQIGQLKALREEARRLGRPQKDADERFEQMYGVKPPQ